MKEVVWYKVEEVRPENTGIYLCISNDNKVMVCHVAANGWWSKIPDPEYYGDMGNKITKDSKRIEREVVYWTYLPDNIPVVE